MSKMIILEGNSNDKDNVRAYMVKGEPGNDGVSPTVATSKTGSVTTVTFTDAEGTHTATINDGEIQKSDVIDVLTSMASQKPLSANQGRVLKSLVDTKANASDCYTKTEIDTTLQSYQLKGDIVVLTGSIEAEASSVGSTTESYPTGFTASNTVLISYGVKLNGGTRGYAYGYTSESVIALALCAGNKYIELASDGIKIYCENGATSSKTFDYKIVIMKAS